MSSPVNLVVIRHARLRPPRRSPHRVGRLTPDSLLENDPRGRTLCGAEPGSHDLDARGARTREGRKWVTCPDCSAAIDSGEDR